MNFHPQSEWLTANEAAAYLKIAVRTLLKRTREGEIKGYALLGNKRRIWRYRKEDLDRYLLAKGVVLSPPPSVLSKKEKQ
jgi:excisionase family DNA binding protein